jgi:hypothetical protein
MPEKENNPSFQKGFSGKFAESLGSRLAFGIVTLVGLVILRFVVADDIARLTPPTETCDTDSSEGQPYDVATYIETLQQTQSAPNATQKHRIIPSPSPSLDAPQ